MADMTKLQAAQAALRAAMDELYGEVKSIIDKVEPLDGVTPYNGPIKGCKVSASALFGQKNFVLAPSYYIPEVQADAVKGVLLKPSLSLDAFTDRLNKMVSEKKVQWNGENIILNPNTLTALENIQAQLM